jgi:outer membrane protein assembly factor BamB
MPRPPHAHRATSGSVERSRTVIGLAAAAGLVAVLGAWIGGAALGTAHGQDPGRSAAPQDAGPGASVTPVDPSVAPSLISSAPPSAAASDPVPSASPPAAAPSRFPGGLLIADRGNGRLLVVTDSGRIAWSFPGPASLPRGQRFAADDAFIAPDGRTIVANDETHQVIDRIDIATRRVVWQYGQYDRPGRGAGQLHTPDDAYSLANGNIVVADIRNCRILEIAPSKRIVHQWGRTGVCVHRPPFTFGEPNGDTPLPDGGLLITEITGSRIVRLSPTGHVIFDVHAPVTYPSDAQLEPDGSIVVVDYASPGAIVRLSPTGHVLWRYQPRTGRGALDHPSLALPLADGTIVVNDDERQRVIVIDPKTDWIVWQYGVTGRPGRSAGHLLIPDGIDVLPPGTIPGLG